MASFSLSKSSLNLTPPSITGGPRSNYATAGDAVNTARIWQANRQGSPDMAGIVAQNSASETSVFNAIKDAEATAMMGGLAGWSKAFMANKEAEAAKAAARKDAKKSMSSSLFGALGTVGGALLTAGNPVGAMIGGQIGSSVGGLIG